MRKKWTKYGDQAVQCTAWAVCGIPWLKIPKLKVYFLVAQLQIHPIERRKKTMLNCIFTTIRPL